MDLQNLKKLIKLIEQHDEIGEIEIKKGDETWRVSKRLKGGHAELVLGAPTHQIAHQEPTALPHTASSTPSHEANQHAVRSPMVGTVYLASTPGAKNYVEVGQTVQAGQTLCVIEAMKMFNPIEADISGKITACLVDNAQPVEYSQALFLIE